MKRKSIQRSSMFKLQAEKSCFKKFLDRLDLCSTVARHPHSIDIISEISQQVYKECYSFGDESPFQRGLNYGNKNFGFSFPSSNQMIYREFIPNAKEAYLLGEFNNFNECSHPLVNEENSYMYSLEVNLQKDRIKDQEKVLLKVVDNQGEVYKIPPPSCRIRDADNKYGVVCMTLEIPGGKSSKKVQALNGYFLDLQKIPLENVSAFLEDHEKTIKSMQTVILLNLFTSPYTTDMGILTIDQLIHFREIADKIKNKFNLKLLIEWDLRCGQKNENNPIDKFVLIEGKPGKWQYDVSKKVVFASYLANMSFFLTTFQVDGFYFRSICDFIESSAKRIDAQVFLRCVNIMKTRVNQFDLTIGEVENMIEGIEESIFEGGLGFTFFVSSEKSGEQLVGSTMMVDLDSAEKMKVQYDILRSSKGYLVGGDLEREQRLLKILELRSKMSDSPFQKIENEEGVTLGRKGETWIAFHDKNSELRINLSKIVPSVSSISILQFTTEKEPYIEDSWLSMQGSGCVLFEPIE